MLDYAQLLIAGFNDKEYYACGGMEDGLPGVVFGVVHLIILIIKIGVPILLIIIGMIDLGKAVVAQKEEEIKKGQSLFIKKLIAAILVFLVVFIVQFVVKFIAPDDQQSVTKCIDCFVNGKNECTELHDKVNKDNTTVDPSSGSENR